MIIGRTIRHEAGRGYGDPYPFLLSPRTSPGEALARHLRAKGRRIAVQLTTIPEGWQPHPDDHMKLSPGCSGKERAAAIMRYLRAIRDWRRELHVGKAL